MLTSTPNPDALLLPYQQRWLADPSRVKVFAKSRRIGITWATAAACVLDAAAGRVETWFVGYDEAGGKEFVLDCAWWCRQFHVAAQVGDVDVLEIDDEGRETNVRALGITFPGSTKRVVALTSVARAIRGKKGRVVIDEAAFHDNLEDLLKAASALLAWPGGELWLLSSFNGEDNAFTQIVRDIQDGKLDYSLHTCTITEARDEGLFRRMCQTEGTEWSEERERKWLEDLHRIYRHGLREELYCEPVGAGQSYLPRSLTTECARVDLPVLRYSQTDDFLSLPEAERADMVREWLDAQVKPLLDALNAAHKNREYKCFAWGLDFGRTQDLTVLAPMGLRQNLVRRVPFMIELSRVPFSEQFLTLEYVVSKLPSVFHGALDAGGSGAWIAEQAWGAFGGDSYVDRVVFTLPFHRDNWPNLRRMFEDRRIEIPSDLDVIRDLAQVQRVSGVPKVPDVRTESAAAAGQRRHGDAAIALLLANSAMDKAEEIFTNWEGYTSL